MAKPVWRPCLVVKQAPCPATMASPVQSTLSNKVEPTQSKLASQFKVAILFLFLFLISKPLVSQIRGRLIIQPLLKTGKEEVNARQSHKPTRYLKQITKQSQTLGTKVHAM